MGGSKKTTQTTNQTQTQNQNSAFNNAISYGEYAPTETADLAAYRNYRPQVDPGIAAQFGNERNRLNQSFINPLGGNYSPHIADAIKRSEGRDISQRESQAFRAGNYDVNQQRMGQLASLAALTQPRLVTTGTSGTGTNMSTGTMQGTGTMTQPSNIFGDILSAGAQVGSAALL